MEFIEENAVKKQHAKTYEKRPITQRVGYYVHLLNSLNINMFLNYQLKSTCINRTRHDGWSHGPNYTLFKYTNYKINNRDNNYVSHACALL